MVFPPLFDANIPDDVVWLHRFSWHVGSVAIAAMISMYIYSSLRPGNLPLVVCATAMATGFACLGVGFAAFGNEALWRTPAPYLWSVVANLGAVGIWTSSERVGT